MDDKTKRKVIIAFASVCAMLFLCISYILWGFFTGDDVLSNGQTVDNLRTEYTEIAEQQSKAREANKQLDESIKRSQEQLEIVRERNQSAIERIEESQRTIESAKSIVDENKRILGENERILTRIRAAQECKE